MTGENTMICRNPKCGKRFRPKGKRKVDRERQDYCDPTCQKRDAQNRYYARKKKRARKATAAAR